MSSESEQWIDEALQTLGLVGRKVENGPAIRIRAEVEARFVVGTPSVWWLSLRSVRANVSAESTTLSSLVRDPDALGYFIPEVGAGDPVAYSLSASEVERVVEECPFFEYYFVCDYGKRLIAETDHNQFLLAEPSDDALR